MKKSIFLILASIALIITSCGKKNADRLLQTIPQNSRFVAIVNGENLMSDLGKEGAAQLQSLFDKPSRDSSNKIASYICSEDSEVDFSTPLCVFEFNNAAIVTMVLKDGDKFRKGIEAQLSAKFEKEKDVYYLADNTVFVKGDQAWVKSGYPEVEATEVNSFTNLPRKSSMADNEYVAEMVAQDSDISWLLDMNAIFPSFAGMGANLWINMMFENPSYLASYVDFEKSEILGELTVLNDKYKPAAFSLRPSGIDTGVLKKFDGRGNLFLATAFDSATVSRILLQLNGLLSLPQEIVSLLESIDGTIAISSYVSDQSGQPEQMSALISMKDNGAASEFASYLSRVMSEDGENVSCQADGNAVILSSPGQQGESFSAVASDFKGASLGLVFNPSVIPAQGNSFANSISSVVVKLVDNADGSTLNFKVKTKEDRNSLVTLLQFANSSK